MERDGAPAGGALAWSMQWVGHAGLLVASVACANLVDAVAWLFASAALFAFASVQLGFLAHDFEHGQVRVRRRWRDPIGLLAWNLMLGVSLAWWRDKHNAHHRHTHIDGHDPDLYALFVYDTDTARGLRGVRRWFVACQAWLFWPITAFARLYFQVLAIGFAWHLPMRRRVAELATLCLHHALLWLAAWSVLGPLAIAFVLVAQLLSGLYMGLAFATNHLGMPLANATGDGRAWQIAHTRDIRAGRIGTYLLGGLNLQVAHHLAPTLDRAALRAMQPRIERECAAAGIAYHRTGLLTALREVHESLQRVAASAR